MIGQRDSEARAVNKGSRRDSMTKKERAEIKEVGIRKAEIVQEKNIAREGN